MRKKQIFKKKVIILINILVISACSGGGSNSKGSPTQDTSQNRPPLVADVTINQTSKTAVSPYFYGQNYWSWVVQWGAQINGSEELMKEVNLNLLRLGGTAPDINSPEAFDYTKIDEGVAYANEIGAEILLQIPLVNDYDGNPITVERAMDIVRYVREQEYPIRYFSIGNEPDLYEREGYKPSYTVNNLTTQFNEYSEALKAIDPNYQILGPDLAFKYTDNDNWLTPFLEGSKHHVDLISIHRYGFSPESVSIENVRGDSVRFGNDINRIKGYFEAEGIATDYTLAITEAHVTYNGEPQWENSEASPSSIWAALWVADMIGIGLEEKLWNLSFWSISEGWTLGFIDGDTGEPRPSYHALKLLSTHTGNQSLGIQYAMEGVSNVSIYATENEESNQTFITFVNKQDNQVSINWKLSSSSAINTIELNPVSINVLVVLGDTVAERWEYNQELSDSRAEPIQR